MKPPSKAQLEAAESDFNCEGWKAMVRERNSRIIQLEALLRDASRHLDAWIKENGPGGWIDNLRIRLEAAEQDSRRLEFLISAMNRWDIYYQFLEAYHPNKRSTMQRADDGEWRAAIDAAMQADEDAV